MYIKDYMTRDVITIEPKTSILNAQDTMRKNDINQLPVMKNNKLVGLVTNDLINRNLPSNVTTLSKNEMNYLIDKISSQDIMYKKVEKVRPDTLLDQAAAIMIQKNIGALVVEENDELVGIITDKDIFKAFIDISGSQTPGTTLIVELQDDQKGVIEEIGDALVETDNNLTHMIVYYRVSNTIRLVISVDTDNVDELVKSIQNRGYTVM